MDIDLFKKELLKPLRAVVSKLETLLLKIQEDKFEEAYLLALAIENEFGKEFNVKFLHLLKETTKIKINGMYDIIELNDEQGKRLESMEKRLPSLTFNTFNEAFDLIKKIKEELNEQK